MAPNCGGFHSRWFTGRAQKGLDFMAAEWIRTRARRVEKGGVFAVRGNAGYPQGQSRKNGPDNGGKTF